MYLLALDNGLLHKCNFQAYIKKGNEWLYFICFNIMNIPFFREIKKPQLVQI